MISNMKSDFDELLYGGEPTKSQRKKTNRIYYIMTVLIALALYITNKIWPFNDELPWWGQICADLFGGFAITGGLMAFYVYVYKGFLRSRHKILFLLGFIAYALFKLLPYILGWKKF
jgi:hypothetical protein